MFHSRSKHIELIYYWIRDVLESKELVLERSIRMRIVRIY
jgi:hypothetical protein